MRYGRGIAAATMGWMVGCGPVVGSELPETGAGTGEDGTSGDADPTDESATQAATSADPSTASDSDATSADESTGGDATTICTDADPTTAIAVLNADTGAAILRADGTQVPLDLPPAADPTEANVYTAFATHGPWVAMTRATSRFDGNVHYDSEVALFAESGDRQWLRTEANASLNVPHVGLDGIIVVSRNHEDSTSDGVRYAGPDDALTLPGFFPRAQQRSDGLVPGWVYPNDTVEPVWFDTATLDLIPITLPPLGSWYEIEDDGAFTYFTASGGDIAFVREGPDGVDLTPMPELGAPPEFGHGVMSSSDRRWLLLVDGDGGAYYRVDTDLGVAEPLDLSPPADLAWFECYGINPSIDDAGRIVMGLRDASAVHFGRLDPTTGEWDLLGQPVTAVDDTAASAHGDTYILRTTGQGMTFCPPQDFEPAEGALVGSTVQVLRPSAATARTLAQDAWPMPRDDGRCLAITDARGVTLVDMEDDTELLVPGMRDVYWWAD